MTIADDLEIEALDDLEARLAAAEEAADAVDEAGPSDELGDDAHAVDDEPVVRPTPLAIASALSGLAPAFLVARLFRGGIAPYVSTGLGVLVGVGLTWLSYKAKRVSLLQCLIVPVATLVGAILVAPAAKGGSANIPSLVVEALKGGGLRQAPIAFDPGWRLLCVVVLAVTVGAAMSVAATVGKPQLVAVVPLPLTAGAAFIQPQGAEVVSSVVAIVFVIGGLMVGYGSSLGGEDGVGRRFEARRLVRGGALMAAVLVAIVALAQTDVLFPATNRDQVIPAQKPPAPRPQADRVLFTAQTDRPGPWRVGVLDVYEDNGFLLPPVDPKLIRVVPKTGDVEAVKRPTYSVSFVLKDLPGHLIPTPAGAAAVTGVRNQLEFDPRTQVLKVRNTRIPAGMTYTIKAADLPDAKELAAAAPPRALIASQFAAAPAAPTGVRQLLASLPQGISGFDRLQAVRQALYTKVVAAGSGKPVDVAPGRVDQMLNGGEASPYEITAAEVLLTRWAGIPARIGFGFYGGDKVGGVTTFRPRDGAAWLEAYFEGYGWVPIVGTPPRAKASLSPTQKKNDPRVVATDELAITVYVPVRRHEPGMLFKLVRYWVGVGLALALAVLLVGVSYPAVLKAVRSRRRVVWALARSPAARVAVAYAEMRDRASDLNIGHPRQTPLEFVDAVDDDDEHTELAWLVTRVLWADLARDLRIEDVEAAEEMARSVKRRLAGEQSGVNRLLGLVARTSLRDPYDDAVPNTWPQRAGSGRVGRVGRVRLGRRGRRVAAAAAAAAASITAGSCVSAHASVPATAMTYPSRLVPARIGTYAVTEEPALSANYAKAKGDSMVQSGRVFAVRSGASIQGTVQVALFKPGVDLRRSDLQRDVEDGIGAGVAVTRRYGLVRVRALRLPEQQMFLWFPPDHNVMELFIMRKSFNDAERVVDSIISYQRGLPAPEAVS